VVVQHRHVGIPEVLTDPSYRGQMVTMNLSAHRQLRDQPGGRGVFASMAAGFIVKEACARSEQLAEPGCPGRVPRQHGIVGTRASTASAARTSATDGSQQGVNLACGLDSSGSSRRHGSPQHPWPDWSEVTSPSPIKWTEGLRKWSGKGRATATRGAPPPIHPLPF